MASSASKGGATKPILKMPVLAPSKFGGGGNLDPPVGGDGGAGGGVGGGGSAFTRTQFPGLKKSKLASLPVVAKATAPSPASSLVSSEAKAFIPLSNQEPLSSVALERPAVPMAVLTSATIGDSLTSNSTAADDDSSRLPVGDRVAAAAAAEEPVFVFGEKLHDRAENFDVREIVGTSAVEDPPKELPNEVVPRKTLSESAAEYCESHSQKRKFEEVKLVTGEENESNVLQIAAKLHVFEKSNSTWLERGRGLLRLNDVRANEESSVAAGSRIVMRTTGSLRVILNTPLYAGMSVERPTDKSIRLTGTDEGQVKIFLISATPKDITELFQNIKSCLSCLEHSSKTSTVETKQHQEKTGDQDDEQPPRKKNSL